MNNFTQYRRSQIAELRPYMPGEDMGYTSISAPDREAGSPKPGDMIARNPANHDDQWLVSAQHFSDNFEPLQPTPGNFIDRLLSERETLQEKHEKLLLFLDSGATGASDTQRHLLSLQLCAMTNYGDILDRRLEDLDFPTGDLEPFCGPGINNVGMENVDGE